MDSFLKALIDNNAKNGAFFSQLVYVEYGKLRHFLEKLREKLATGRVATNDEIHELYSIIRGQVHGSGVQDPGVGTQIKNELGSYISMIITATHGAPVLFDTKQG